MLIKSYCSEELIFLCAFIETVLAVLMDIHKCDQCGINISKIENQQKFLKRILFCTCSKLLACNAITVLS